MNVFEDMSTDTKFIILMYSLLASMIVTSIIFWNPYIVIVHLLVFWVYALYVKIYYDLKE